MDLTDILGMGNERINRCLICHGEYITYVDQIKYLPSIHKAITVLIHEDQT